MKVTPKLGKILKERGITQLELEQRTGIAQGTISRFDRNERHNTVQLFTISRALQIPIEELFEVEEDEE